MFITSYLQELDGLDEKTSVVLKIETRWVPPTIKMVKLNFDATYVVEDSRSGSGIVAKNERGIVLASTTLTYDCVHSVFPATAFACLEAVRMGVRMGFLK